MQQCRKRLYPRHMFESEFDKAIAEKKGVQPIAVQLPEGKIVDILVAPDPKLRSKTKNVERFDDELLQLVANMSATMKRSNGMGLAANQIGSDLRVIVMDVDNLAAYEDTVPQDILLHGQFILINPEIIEMGTRPVKWAEGCLSVPGFQFEIERPGFVVVRALNPDGSPVELRMAGLLAACVQHEIDHLDGKLFIDHVSRLKRDMVIRKLQKFRKKGSMVVRAHNAPNL